MPEKRWMSPMPDECQICGVPFEGEAFFIDGVTRMGPWAIMCVGCHNTHGRGLGIGQGQMYSTENHTTKRRALEMSKTKLELKQDAKKLKTQLDMAEDMLSEYETQYGPIGGSEVEFRPPTLEDQIRGAEEEATEQVRDILQELHNYTGRCLFPTIKIQKDEATTRSGKIEENAFSLVGQQNIERPQISAVRELVAYCKEVGTWSSSERLYEWLVSKIRECV